MLGFVFSPPSLSYQINLLGEKDDTPVHFCDKCGLPIKMYGRMVSEITSGRCSHGFPLDKMRFYCVCMRLLEITDFNRHLNEQQSSTRMELEAFTAQVVLFHLSDWLCFTPWFNKVSLKMLNKNQNTITKEKPSVSAVLTLHHLGLKISFLSQLKTWSEVRKHCSLLCTLKNPWD